MRVIIVDDEQLLVHELKRLLEACTSLEVVGTYTDPLNALDEVDLAQPDVAFLDIEMRGINGIELAEKLMRVRPNLEVLFVTAFNHYATEAFEANAVDYLLKPVRPERLQKALLKLNGQGDASPAIDTESVSVQFFGKFGVYKGKQLIKWSRAKQRELIAYLLQNEGKWIDKYRLCESLWRDSSPNQALSHLQTAVWALRKTIKEQGIQTIRIEYQSDSYRLTAEGIQWDLRDFKSAVDRYKSTQNPEDYRAVELIYNEGYLYYDDWLWAIIDREAYSRLWNQLKRSQQA